MGRILEQSARALLLPHRCGPKQLVKETSKWKRLAGAIARVLDAHPIERRRMFRRKRTPTISPPKSNRTCSSRRTPAAGGAQPGRGESGGAARVRQRRALDRTFPRVAPLAVVGPVRCRTSATPSARGARARVDLVAALTIALGVGATTAVFSVVDATLLRPLPYPQPERLVSVIDDLPGRLVGRRHLAAGMARPR